MHYCNKKKPSVFKSVRLFLLRLDRNAEKIASKYVTNDNFVLRSLVNTKENLHKSSCEFYQNREIHWEHLLFDIQLY